MTAPDDDFVVYPKDYPEGPEELRWLWDALRVAQVYEFMDRIEFRRPVGNCGFLDNFEMLVDMLPELSWPFVDPIEIAGLNRNRSTIILEAGEGPRHGYLYVGDLDEPVRAEPFSRSLPEWFWLYRQLHECGVLQHGAREPWSEWPFDRAASWPPPDTPEPLVGVPHAVSGSWADSYDAPPFAESITTLIPDWKPL